MPKAIQVGDRVYIKERRHMFFRTTGYVLALRPSDSPWMPARVSIKLDIGKQLVIEPEAITPEKTKFQRRVA